MLTSSCQRTFLLCITVRYCLCKQMYKWLLKSYCQGIIRDHLHYGKIQPLILHSSIGLWLHYIAIEPIGCATCMLKEARQACEMTLLISEPIWPYVLTQNAKQFLKW